MKDFLSGRRCAQAPSATQLGEEEQATAIEQHQPQVSQLYPLHLQLLHQVSQLPPLHPQLLQQTSNSQLHPLHPQLLQQTSKAHPLYLWAVLVDILELQTGDQQGREIWTAAAAAAAEVVARAAAVAARTAAIPLAE